MSESDALADPSRHELRIAGIVDRIRQIPKGSVRTYGEIDPRAPRLVGLVLATTKHELPWQRVVRADGSVAKGDRQRRLLRKEGVPMRGARVDLDRARMLSNLPSAVAGYLRAADGFDTGALVACFTKDADLTDQGQTWRGRAGIRRWWTGPANQFKSTLAVRGGQRTGDRYVLRIRLTGNFPGGTADLRYRFTLRDGLIRCLTISP